MLLDELQNRYELKSRKGIYARIKALGLQLPKDNKRRSYATMSIDFAACSLFFSLPS